MFINDYDKKTQIFPKNPDEKDREFIEERAKIAIDYAVMQIASPSAVRFIDPADIKAIAKIPSSHEDWSHVVILKKGHSGVGLLHSTKHIDDFVDAGLIERSKVRSRCPNKIMVDLFRKIFSSHLKDFVFKEDESGTDLRTELKAEIDGCPIKIAGARHKFNPDQFVGTAAEGISNRGKTMYTEIITMFPQQQKKRRRSVPPNHVFD